MKKKNKEKRKSAVLLYNGKYYICDKPVLKCISKDGEYTFAGFKEVRE